jgi:hypothetical protein
MKLNRNNIGNYPDVELRIIFDSSIKPELFNCIKNAMEAWACLCINRGFGDGVIHNYSEAVLDDEYEKNNAVLMHMDWGSSEEDYLKYLFRAIDEICKVYNETGYYGELNY